LYGIAMFQKLHDSRVTLNTHLDASVGSASNMRLYEATGVGACLLTDWKANLKELFEPDVEVVVYRDSLECVAKYRELIADEPRRRRIAQAGQRRAMRDHTVAHRAEQLHELLLDA
jgi:spore maturation protein CgeB